MSIKEKINYNNNINISDNNNNNNNNNNNTNSHDNNNNDSNLNSPVKNQTLTPNKLTNKSNTTTSSCSKNWCSPFTNFLTLTPEAPSRYSMADLSPHSIFSSPWIQQASEVSSPLSLNKTSFFSPSLFSPFNKSLNPLKLDKFNIDYDDSTYSDSKYSPRNIEDSENGLNTPYNQFENNFDGITPLSFGNDDSNKLKKNSTLTGTKRKNDDISNSSISSSLLEAIELYSPTPKQNPDNKFIESKRTKLPQILPKSKIPSSYDKKSPSSTLSSLSTTTTNNSNINITSISNPTNPIHSSSSSGPNNSNTSRLKSNSIDFTSPALITQAQETNMSPDMSQRNTCNCKKSRCLKLYCECFAALRYCSSCHCVECNNIAEFESVRQEVIQSIRDRNSSAFQLKVNINRGHMAGCHCKKSRCLKKYCECFEGSVYCGPNCKCVECQNIVDSEALKQVKLYGNVKEKKDRASQQKTELSDSDCDISNNNLRNIRQPLFNQFNNNNNNQQQLYNQQQNSRISALISLAMNPKNIIPSTNTVYSDICSARGLSNNFNNINNNINNNNKFGNIQQIDTKQSILPIPIDSLIKTELKQDNQTISQEISQAEEKEVTSNITVGIIKKENNYNDIDNDNDDHGKNEENQEVKDKIKDDINNNEAIKSENEMMNKDEMENISSSHQQQQQQQQQEPLYPFFGGKLPPTSKLIALSCLQYLDGPSLYSISCVNHLWNQAVMDDALWE